MNINSYYSRMLFNNAFNSTNLFNYSYNKNMNSLYSSIGISPSNRNNADNTLTSLVNDKLNSYKKNIDSIQKYTEDKTKFYSDFNDKFSKLNTDSKKLMNYSSSETLPYKIDSDETKANAQTDKITDAVSKFVDDYNDTVDFLDKNSDVSEDIDDLNTQFTDVKYENSKLNAIGISADSSGKLTLDKSKLKDSIKNNYDQVKDVLKGQDGLARDTYINTSKSMYSAKDLYPEFKFEEEASNTYSYMNSNVLLSGYNSAFSSGMFLNYLL